MSKLDLEKIALDLYLQNKEKSNSLSFILRSLIELKDLTKEELNKVLECVTRIESGEIEIVNLETPSEIKDISLLKKVEEAIQNKINKDFIIHQVISSNFNKIVVKVGDREMHI